LTLLTVFAAIPCPILGGDVAAMTDPDHRHAEVIPSGAAADVAACGWIGVSVKRTELRSTELRIASLAATAAQRPLFPRLQAVADGAPCHAYRGANRLAAHLCRLLI
jgi:hypothetical protein